MLDAIAPRQKSSVPVDAIGETDFPNDAAERSNVASSNFQCGEASRQISFENSRAYFT